MAVVIQEVAVAVAMTPATTAVPAVLGLMLLEATTIIIMSLKRSWSGNRNGSKNLKLRKNKVSEKSELFSLTSSNLSPFFRPVWKQEWKKVPVWEKVEVPVWVEKKVPGKFKTKNEIWHFSHKKLYLILFSVRMENYQKTILEGDTSTRLERG